MTKLLLNPKTVERLRKQLKRHEGVRFYPYEDSVGKTTIGVGRNLDDRGLTSNEIEKLLDTDVLLAYADATAWLGLHTFFELNEARQLVILDMTFNMGYTTISQFKKLKAALVAHDYAEAVKEMEDSKWCRQVGKRCTTLKNMMLTGEV